eukprot:TRINITY_DN90215_c0_g1_i1.p1 TRINITY_DN90215_c0_g1~~TRINITY_DN90215_c0_g1_i1.p1  ORF type:complete len:875 (-),score=168.94 TRINITY_DN90215_c0_g1_i1:323-2947(-)
MRLPPHRPQSALPAGGQGKHVPNDARRPQTAGARFVITRSARKPSAQKLEPIKDVEHELTAFMATARSESEQLGKRLQAMRADRLKRESALKEEIAWREKELRRLSKQIRKTAGKGEADEEGEGESEVETADAQEPETAEADAISADGGMQKEHESLPPDPRLCAWERVYDEHEGDYFFHNVETGEASWDPPVGWEEAQQTAPQDDGFEHGAASGSCAAPGRWTRMYDESSGDYYYVNEDTGEATWDEPAEFHEQPPWQTPPSEAALASDSREQPVNANELSSQDRPASAEAPEQEAEVTAASPQGSEVQSSHQQQRLAATQASDATAASPQAVQPLGQSFSLALQAFQPCKATAGGSSVSDGLAATLRAMRAARPCARLAGKPYQEPEQNYVGDECSKGGGWPSIKEVGELCWSVAEVEASSEFLRTHLPVASPLSIGGSGLQQESGERPPASTDVSELQGSVGPASAQHALRPHPGGVSRLVSGMIIDLDASLTESPQEQRAEQAWVFAEMARLQRQRHSVLHAQLAPFFGLLVAEDQQRKHLIAELDGLAKDVTEKLMHDDALRAKHETSEASVSPRGGTTPGGIRVGSMPTVMKAVQAFSSGVGDARAGAQPPVGHSSAEDQPPEASPHSHQLRMPSHDQEARLPSQPERSEATTSPRPQRRAEGAPTYRLKQPPEAVRRMLDNIAELRQHAMELADPWGRMLRRLDHRLSSQKAESEALRAALAAEKLTACEGRKAKAEQKLRQVLEHVRDEAGSTLKALDPVASWLSAQEQALVEALGQAAAPPAAGGAPSAPGPAQPAATRPGQAAPLIADVRAHIANMSVAQPMRPGRTARGRRVCSQRPCAAGSIGMEILPSTQSGSLRSGSAAR